MNIRLKPCRFCGEVTAISSKSDAHRLLIASALSDRPTFIRCNARSADITATVNCLNSLGADIKFVDGGISVKPIKEKRKVPYSIVMRVAQPSDFYFPLPHHSVQTPSLPVAADFRNVRCLRCVNKWRLTVSSFHR